MTVTVPDPVPLEMPPGDPEAVEELVRDVAGAVFWLTVLRDELSGPAASAHGWLGADAAAAASQVVRVAGLARDAAAAALGVTGRLGAHGELLRETRRGVRSLRAEQKEDHQAAWERLHGLNGIGTAMRTGAPEAVAIVEDFEATEAARRRRHAVLLEELADDAAATARVLADAGRPVGGVGRPGDGGRVLAYLAAELPGWGDPELTALGRVLADALVRSPATPEERAALAAEAAAYAGNHAFATALVRGLGEVGVGQLLVLLGQDPDGPRNPMAALLASALGAAVPGDGKRDRVSAVLGATYVRADDGYGPSDSAAAGMAAVLSAGTHAAGGGPRMVTVGEWARQLLVREHVQALPAGLPPAGMPWRRDARDPAALAVGILARGGEPEVAAALLGDDRVWEALLLRFWGDGGIALGELVVEAGRDAGPAGDRAVRLGLETVGAGLFEGDPSDRAVDRETLAAVAPALGAVVAAHVPVVTGALTAVATGDVGEGAEHLLKGLGYLTVDRQTAATVEAALTDWSRTQSLDLAGSGPASPLPAVAVPSAYLAVQEYGQRLTHALDGFELQEDAENKQLFWSWTAGLALELISYVPVKPVGVVADIVNGYAPILLGMDGTWDDPVDRGLRFGADDAAGNALATLPPERAAQAHAVQAQAEASYRRTAEALGLPEAPESPETDWLGPVIEIATGGLVDTAKADHTPGRR
jgi:hypothetical protein